MAKSPRIDRFCRKIFEGWGCRPRPRCPTLSSWPAPSCCTPARTQRSLAFEMPGNRNGASDRGGDKHCDDFSRALGWRGACPERLMELQVADEQLSNDTLAAV